MEHLTIFREDLVSFFRLSDSLTQIPSSDDTSLEPVYIFFEHLEALVWPDRIRRQIDLSDAQHRVYRETACSTTDVKVKRSWPRRQ